MLFALLPTLAQAQVTPEAIIGQCPQLPTVAELSSLNQDAVDAFTQEINQAIRQVKKANEKQMAASTGQYRSDLNASLKAQYGKTADDFESMSETERQRFGENYAQKRLQSMGINRSAAELSNMSETQQQQLAAQMATNRSGLSAADMQKLQKMENMSSEEALAYLQQSGMLEKMQAMGRGVPQANRQSTASVGRTEEYMNTINAHNSKVSDFTTKRRKKQEALLTLARELYDKKYRATIEALRKELAEVTDPSYQGDSEAQQKILISRIDGLNVEYRTAIAAPWREQIVGEMAQIKLLIQSASKADAANKSLLQSRGDAVPPQQEATSWAIEYLLTAANVTEFMPSL